MLSQLLLCSLLAVPALAASAEDWRSRSIYQLITDRFALQNDSSVSCDTSNRKYCGGSWQGIINKLDYIQDMGFDAVWISPIVKNVEGETGYGEAFHGYWTEDIYSLNTHFGDADDLKALATALHARSMYLMVDIVVNHMVATTNPPNYGSFTPFNTESDFHAECFITDYTNQTDVEQCWLGDTTLPLADINTEDDTIVSTWNTWVGQLVSNYSIDGLRIDTVKHVRKDFWGTFATSAGVYTIGEVLDNRTSYVSPYTEQIDGVLDYPTWYVLVAGFQTQYGNLSALAGTVEQSQSSYKNGEFFTGAFLENQDQPRFQSLTQDVALIRNAMTFPFIQDGLPILYYGQEQGYTGGADPSNREALWLSGFDTNKTLVQHVTALNSARKQAAAVNSSFYTSPVQFLSRSESTLAVYKAPLLALLSNGGNTSTPSWSVSGTGYSANEALVDVLTCNTFNADSNGGVSRQGSGGMPQVILPASSLNQSGTLCASVATGSSSTQASSAAGAYVLPVGLALTVGALLAGLSVMV